MGKSGSGSSCSATATGGANPAAANTLRTTSVPTPCIAVCTMRSSRGPSARAGRRPPRRTPRRSSRRAPSPARATSGISRTEPTAVDGRLDLAIGRRHDLRAVVGIDLVPVVLRRVVRGGDHHPGRRAADAGPRRPAPASAAIAAARARRSRPRRRSPPSRRRTRETAVPPVVTDHDRTPRRTAPSPATPPGPRPRAAPPRGSSRSARRAAVRAVRPCRRSSGALNRSSSSASSPARQQRAQLIRGGGVHVVVDPCLAPARGVPARSRLHPCPGRHFVDTETGRGEAAADERVGRVRVGVGDLVRDSPPRRRAADIRVEEPRPATRSGACSRRCPTPARRSARARAGRRRPVGRSRPATARSTATDGPAADGAKVPMRRQATCMPYRST